MIVAFIKSKRRKLIAGFIILILFIFSYVLIGKIFFKKGIPFVKRLQCWSIGIYIGNSPFELSPDDVANPVLTAKNVTDVRARFVADPFMVKEGDSWYMFFEVMNKDTKQGDIGLAVSSNGLNWYYKQIVLDESFHLSYPYVFKWKNEYYMIPESCAVNSIRLYKAVNFPTKWSLVKVLLKGYKYSDNSIFRLDNKWWIFTSRDKSDILRLFYAKDLLGPWTEHPKSPLIKGNANIARPGGRVLVFEDRVIRYAQDDEPEYGGEVKAFEITKLTTADYREKAISINPILKGSGSGWNKEGMHTIDLHRIGEDKWIACVDGFAKSFPVLDIKFSLKNE